mmetsp:Transcript_2149/g.3398  ORF Transcript_2149/g.3398 Transcript_2149/m.3398 type:complete len:104 (-) Transcript_2149:172-483(-)
MDRSIHSLFRALHRLPPWPKLESSFFIFSANRAFLAMSLPCWSPEVIPKIDILEFACRTRLATATEPGTTNASATGKRCEHGDTNDSTADRVVAMTRNIAAMK